MKVQLQKTFELPGSADVAWAIVQDIEALAGCMPGARITERVDERHYKGTVAVKLGPASMAFKGTVELQLVDPAARSLKLVGKGTDAGGGSGASMDLSARIERGADEASSRLVGDSTVSMSGKAATFGARLMNPVAEQVLQQFAANLAAKVAALQAERAAAVAPSAAAAATDAPAAPGAAPAPDRELDGLALAWAVLKGWLRGLLGARNP